MSSAIMRFLFLVLPLLFIFFLLALLRRKKKSVLRCKLPPSPPKLPIIGNLHQLGKLPHRNLWELSQEYGPAMLLQLGCVPTFVVSSADFAKQVLKDHDISFCSRPRSPGPKQMFYGFLDVAFTPYGNHWRATRKIFVHHLLGPKKAESFSSARAVEIHHLVDYLSAASPNPVNLDDKIFDLADGVIGAVAFGKSYRGKQFEGQLLRDVIVEAMRMIDSFSAEDFFPNFFGRTIDLLTGHKARLDKCFHKLDGYLEMVLDEHLNRENTRKGDDDDLVDVLLGLSNEETGLPLTREHIKAIFMNTFLGGVDTSAIVIIWAMSELIRNPQTMQKAQAEIRTKLGVKTTLEPDDLGKLTFLKMIVKETLRLHPPVPLLLPRETRRMCQIHAENNTVYNISPQTRVLINAWAIGRDPNTWNKPNEFLPERFEGNEVDFRGQHFEFVPFGGGRRMCPGISNSIATIELTLANLLYWFDWEVAEGMKVEEIGSLEEEGGVTMHKRTKLTLVPINYAWL